MFCISVGLGFSARFRDLREARRGRGLQQPREGSGAEVYFLTHLPDAYSLFLEKLIIRFCRRARIFSDLFFLFRGCFFAPFLVPVCRF